MVYRIAKKIADKLGDVGAVISREKRNFGLWQVW